jgi:hypothetical protein
MKRYRVASWTPAKGVISVSTELSESRARQVLEQCRAFSPNMTHNLIGA